MTVNTQEKVADRNQKIHHYFGRNHTDEFGWKISLVEKEHPGAIKKIRAFAADNNISLTGFSINSLFDYHPSWPFARISTGWLYYDQTEKYHELLKLCFELIEHYPEIKIVMNHVDEIEFVTRSCYIDTPELNARFERECEYARRFAKVFPKGLYLQVKDWLNEHQEFIDPLVKFPDFKRHVVTTVQGNPGMLMSDDEASVEWATNKGCPAHVSFSFQMLKDDALKIKKKLVQAGFDADLCRKLPGFYRFNIVGKKVDKVYAAQ